MVWVLIPSPAIMISTSTAVNSGRIHLQHQMVQIRRHKGPSIRHGVRPGMAAPIMGWHFLTCMRSLSHLRILICANQTSIRWSTAKVSNKSLACNRPSARQIIMHLVYTIRPPSPPGPRPATAYLSRPKCLAEIGTKLCKGYH